MAYGLSQPVLMGEMSVEIPDDFSFDEFNRLVETFTEAPNASSQEPRDGAYSLLCRILEWYCSLQRNQKIPVFGPFHVKGINAGSSVVPREFFVAVPFASTRASLKTLAWIERTVNHFMADRPLDVKATSARMRKEFDELLVELREFSVIGVNNFAFIENAYRMGIPCNYVTDGTYSFGIGMRRRLLRSSYTDKTSVIGASIAKKKTRTARMLSQSGLPAPRHLVAKDEEEAVSHARDLGYPVVVKPDDQEQGRGVAAGLTDAEQVVDAWREAETFSGTVLVEKHVDGEDYRLTVFDGNVVKIMRRRAGGVVGNDIDTVRTLVAREQQTPRMERVFKQTGRRLLEIDEEAKTLLQEQGYAADSIPERGEFVRLRRKCNLSTGGSYRILDPAEVHPANLELAVRAARAVKLDLAGVDLIMPDIKKSWLDCEAVIPEVNAMPQIGVHVAPDLYPLILQQLVEGDGRIPVHLVIYASERLKPEKTGLKSRAHQMRCNGLSTIDGIWIDGRRVTKPQKDGFHAAQILLVDEAVHAALCLMSAAEVSQFGLPAERFDSIRVITDTALTTAERNALVTVLEMARPHSKKRVMEER